MADEKARDAKPGSRNPTNGRFEGGSGNPLGRPKALPMFRSRCRERTDERVFDAWVDEIEVRERVVGHAFGAPIMDVCRGKERYDYQEPAHKSADKSARIQAHAGAFHRLLEVQFGEKHVNAQGLDYLLHQFAEGYRNNPTDDKDDDG